MSKRKDAYSFTTNSTDNYFERVLAEASPKTNFLIVTETSTLTGETNAAVFAKEAAVLAIGELFPNERLAGIPLGDWIFNDGTAKGYYVSVIGGLSRQAAEEKVAGVRSELNRLENILHGRTLRVTVETR